MLERQKIEVKFRLGLGALLLASLMACSGKPASTTPDARKQSVNDSTQSPGKSGASGAGTATGSYTANGETVVLKYAYAGRGQRFGEDSVIVLVTDQPIPSDAVAEEIKSQPLLLDKKIRGLEYVFSKGGYWVRFHPSQYQESKPGQLKEYAVENNVVKGTDEDSGDLTNGKYQRSVKFVATVSK